MDNLDDKDTYTGVEGEQIFMTFFMQKMDEVKRIQKDQQSRDLREGERRIITISTDVAPPADVVSRKVESTKNLIDNLPSPHQLSTKKRLATFDQAYAHYNHLKQKHLLAENQTLFKKCIQISVRHAKHLLKNPSVNSRKRSVIGITQSMFTDYFALFRDDRNTLRLQLNFRDNLKDRGFNESESLSSLLEDDDDSTIKNSDNSTESLPTLPDNITAEKHKNTEHLSFEQLTIHWEKIQEGSMRPHVLHVELAKLSKKVSTFIHHNPHLTERKQQLALGLVVEEYRIRQMQQSSREHLRALSRSIQKSARYFRMLHTEYLKTNTSEALKNEIKISYQLMEARAEDYEQMLACYFVETSKKTTTTEKANAQKRRSQYHLDNTEDLKDLCRRYHALMSDYGFIPPDQSPFDNLSSEDKYKFLSELVPSGVDLNLLQKSKTYLIDMYCQFLSSLQHVSSAQLQNAIITSESLQNVDILPMYELHVHDLLYSDLGQKLQRAIQLHSLIKHQYLAQLHSIHPNDEFIKHEYFCADFRLKAYKLLLSACVHEDNPENITLIERNCWDIIDAGDYKTPILEQLARYKLNALNTLEESTEEWFTTEPDNTEIQKDTAQMVMPQVKTKAQQKAHQQQKNQDEETVWSQLCTAHAVTSICFSTYLETIQRDQAITHEMAAFLYQAISNSDKPLLVNEHTVDMFYNLYGMLVSNYYIPEEFSSLEYALGENIIHGKKNERLSNDKLMVKAIIIHEEILKFIRIYRPELQLKVMLSLIEVFYKMHRMIPKREFLLKCEPILKKAQECIHLEQDSKVKLQIIHLIKNVRQLMKDAPLEKEHQTFIAVDKYMQETYAAAKNDLIAKTAILAKQPLKLSERIRTVKDIFNQHTLLLQIRSALHVTFDRNTGVWQKILPLLYAINAQLYFLSFLQYEHMLVINDFYAKQIEKVNTTSPDKLPELISWLHTHYALNLAYHVKIAEMLDDERYTSLIGITKQVSEWLIKAQATQNERFELLRNKIQEISGVTPVLPSFDEVKQNQLSTLSLDIPEVMHNQTRLSSECIQTILYIGSKQYWQALYMITNEDTAPACF
ncbi:MAG: hypothetical protein K0U37_08515, partial [Gammaproteobacteria bacterium]|nr:hypothetical protein [Gammaproteobacteria bacterium]